MALTLKTGQAKLWVLLIGVSQYHDRRFPILQYSTIDAQRLADTFTDVTPEFPNTSIKLHHDSATAPTLIEVRSSLETIMQQAKPEDTVVFYFCGHGALDSRLQQVVFCLADTQKDAMLKTGLSAIGLLGLLGNCAAKQQILWIDVCHANGMTVQTDVPELIDNPVEQLIQMFRQHGNQNPGFQALLSCDAPSRKDRIQQSWKFPELGHGIFSHFLIEGLRGAAANPQGIVTASVLANFVRDRTAQYIDRNNQQLNWLHRDTKNHTPKAISQTPTRVGQDQAQIVLGIKPTDPLKLLFPDIEAQTIDPPLDRSISLRKPKLEVTATETVIAKTIVPPQQSVDEKSVDETIPKQAEPEPVITSIQSIVPEPIVSEPEPVITSIQPIVPEPIVSEPEPVITSIQPIVPEPIALSEVESAVLPIQKIEPAGSELVPVIREPIQPLVPEPIQPVLPKRNKVRYQLKRLRRTTKKRLQRATVAIAQAKQSAENFAIAQHAQSRQQAAELQHSLTTKLSSIHRAVYQAANSGQALYRRHTAEVSHRATDAVQQINRSTRHLTQSVIEQTRKPQARQRLNVGLKVLGVVAVGVAGAGFYQSRNDQIHAIQQLSNTATTQLVANQPALATALKAGHKLQQFDRPWNFVPESLKITTIATLQQAIEIAEEPPTTVGILLSNASFSPDQKTFAVSTQDNSIQLWQRDYDKFQQRGAALKGHQAAITQLVFSPDGKRLASGSADKTIKLWDVEKGILIQTLSAHTQAVTALSFRSDGEVLASGSADQTIKLWGVARGRILDTFKGHNAIASVIRFSPDGRILAAGTLTNTIHLWYPDSQNPILLGSHNRTVEQTQGIRDLAFSPDGKTIVSAGADPTIKLWAVGEAKAEREAVPTQTLTGHGNTVTSLSFSADGKILASGGRDRTIRLWNVENGTFLKTLFGSQEAIEHLSFSPDRKALFSIGNRYGLKVWNLDLDSLMQTGCQLLNDRTECS